MNKNTIVNAALWRRIVEFKGERKFMSFVRLSDGRELGPFPDRSAAERAFVDWCEAGAHSDGSNVVPLSFLGESGR